MPSSSNCADAARSTSLTRPSSSPAVSAVSPVRCVRKKSRRRSLISIPHALNTSAARGITTRRMPSSAASATACIPPPPPNATSVKSRGSWPRLTDTSLSALIMLLFAIRTIPRAASSRGTPSVPASASSTPATASMSASISPPQKYSGLIRPSSRLASVVVASPPPRPYDAGPGTAPAERGTDVELAEVVDPGDAAAAVPDLDEVDDRDHDRVPRRALGALDPVVGRDAHMAALDQRALRRRPADVEREHVRLADQPPQRGGAPDTAGRAALDHGDRDPADALERVDAAVGLHHVQLAGEAVARHAVAEPLQVALGDRLHVARQHRRVRALVLAPLARDLVRGDRADLGPQPADLGEHRLLVGRIGVGVEQADRDRLDALGAEVVEDRRQPVQVQRRALGARRREPAADLAAQEARHERRRLLVEQVEEVRPVPARDLEAVAEPGRRDQAGRDALALGQSVDHDRRAVGEDVEPARAHARPRDHVEHAALEVGRRRGGLRRDDLLPPAVGVGVQADEVGERAPDVGRQPPHRLHRLSLRTIWSAATASRISTPWTSCW